MDKQKQYSDLESEIVESKEYSKLEELALDVARFEQQHEDSRMSNQLWRELHKKQNELIQIKNN